MMGFTLMSVSIGFVLICLLLLSICRVRFSGKSSCLLYEFDEFEGYHMEVLRGCLCLVVQPDGSNRTGVWMMEKYGVRDSWTKFVIANPGMSVGHVGHVLCLSSEGKLVLKSYGQIVHVNGEILKGFEVRDHYIETLVSPNHGGQIRKHCEASLGKEHPGSSPAN